MAFFRLSNKAEILKTGTAALVLYIISCLNFLLFHNIAETYMIVVSICIFAASWNAKDTISKFFVLLGITFLSVGIIRVFHQMTYEGVAIFSSADMNLSIQFWIVSRYLGILGILSAILFCQKSINYTVIISITMVLLLILVILIMVFRLFPDCCVTNRCTTGFKLISEYILIVFNLLAAGLLYTRNSISSGLVMPFLLSAWACFFFSIQKNEYEMWGVFGHILEMFSLYFFYRASAVTGVQESFNRLIYHLKNSELELRRSRDDLETRMLKNTQDLDYLNKNLQLEMETRRLKEKELKKSEEHLSLLLKSSRMFITHFDNNLRPLPLFQNDKSPFIYQHNLYRLSLLPGWQLLDKMIRSVIQSKKGIREDIEFKTFRESLFFDVVIEPSFDENSNISGVFVIALDITEKKKIESVLKIKHQAIESIYTIATSHDYQKETIYEKICQSIAAILEAPVVTIGRVHNNKICSCDRYINQKYEHSDAIMDCALFKILFSAETACQISGNIKELYPDNACLKYGAIKTYLGVPVLSRNGELNGIICVMDMRERKFAGEQIQLLEIFARYISNEIEKEMFVKELVQSREMALLGKLTSGFAHEVRNPLNAIWAITEALFLEIGTNESNLIYKEHIHSQVQRLSRLMQDLIDLGKPQVCNDRFSFSSLCRETIDSWTQKDSEKTHSVIFDSCFENDQFIIQGDSTKMKQVLMNLLDNAAENSPGGSKITCNIMPAQPGHLCFSISDEGPGISSDLMNRVFDPFFTTRKGGTGLGLSIVKHIVENHNGTISLINNTPAPGVTVKICLPLTIDSNVSSDLRLN